MKTKVIKCLSDYLGIDESKVTAETELVNDLGMNSFDLVQLSCEMEEQFNTKIEPEKLTNVKYVGDLLTLQQTHDMLEKARALWNEWIEIFRLDCTIETANDSFFASNYKKLKIFQVLGDSKQEFRVRITHNDAFCAVSSSNVHRTHFTKEYNIRNEGSYCQSACFAFGIERLAYALLSQKGIDPDKWDEATRKEIFGA